MTIPMNDFLCRMQKLGEGILADQQRLAELEAENRELRGQLAAVGAMKCKCGWPTPYACEMCGEPYVGPINAQQEPIKELNIMPHRD